MSGAGVGRAPRGQHGRNSQPKAPVFIIGLGLGAFLDGILMHQLLQWHHMLTGTGEHPSETLGGKETNVFADGVFHAGTWLLVVLGMVLLVRAWQRQELAPSWRIYVGFLLAGWGVFNLVEGTINHQILRIHHVRDDLGGPLSWDVGFLLFGLALVVIGILLARSRSSGRPSSSSTDQTTFGAD